MLVEVWTVCLCHRQQWAQITPGSSALLPKCLKLPQRVKFSLMEKNKAKRNCGLNMRQGPPPPMPHACSPNCVRGHPLWGNSGKRNGAWDPGSIMQRSTLTLGTTRCSAACGQHGEAAGVGSCRAAAAL